MKTDDDMYINIKNLYELVARNTIPHMLTGALICGAKPIRDPHNKWHSPKYMFQDHIYPDYVSGTGYVMSYSAAKILFQMALAVPAFHLEDVYITGILPSKVATLAEKQMSILHSSTSSFNQSFTHTLSSNSKGPIRPVVIKPKDDYRFSFLRAKSDPCVYHQIISSHHLSMKQIREMYGKVLKVRLKPQECPKLKVKEIRPYTPGRCMNKWRKRFSGQSNKLVLKKKQSHSILQKLIGN